MEPEREWACASRCEVETFTRFLAPIDDPQPLPAAAVLVAHPDDETAGAAGRLGRLSRALFVYTTDGAPDDPADALRAGYASRNAYAQARLGELGAVLGRWGISSRQIRCLGYVDQQAALHLVPLIERLVRLLASGDYRVVLTHAYEGGHPDHDSTALAAHAAAHILRRQGRRPPVLLELASYHLSGESMHFGAFLPNASRPAVTVQLTDQQQAEKRRLFAMFPSQRSVLEAFPVHREEYRIAPRYNFAEPPHGGPLLYERFPWGMTGRRWRQLAAAAMKAFGLPPDQEI